MICLSPVLVVSPYSTTHPLDIAELRLCLHQVGSCTIVVTTPGLEPSSGSTQECAITQLCKGSTAVEPAVTTLIGLNRAQARDTQRGGDQDEQGAQTQTQRTYLDYSHVAFIAQLDKFTAVIPS